MLIWAADPAVVVRARREGRWRSVRRAAVAAVLFVGLTTTFTSVSLHPRDERVHALALALQEGGVTTAAQSVEVRIRGRNPVQVRATFEAGGETVTAWLAEADPNLSDYPRDWVPLRERSAYELPLAVRYLPSDPTQAMAAVDVAEWTDAGVVSEGVRQAWLGLVPAGVAVLLWLVAGRPPWWRYATRIGDVCWCCAHRKDEHVLPGPGQDDAERRQDDAEPHAAEHPAGTSTAGPHCLPQGSRLTPARPCPCPGWVAMAQHVVVTDSALLVWRRGRLRTIPRDAITGIRGDSANLSWSSNILVEAGSRTVSLPVVGGWDVADVPTLRAWAGLDEATGTRADPSTASGDDEAAAAR